MPSRICWLLKVVLITLIGTPIVLVAAVITLVLTSGLWGPVVSRCEGVQRLALASSREEMEAAVGVLGEVFFLPRGDWVAIYYTDSHIPFWSEAVALDSEGRSYEGHPHFCGILGAFTEDLPSLREDVEAARAEAGGDWRPEPHDPIGYTFQLLGIAEATNLEAARVHLGALGIVPIRSHAVPRLRRLAESGSAGPRTGSGPRTSKEPSNGAANSSAREQRASGAGAWTDC